MKIQIQNLYKIFGAAPDRVLAGVRAGESDEVLRERHGGVIALRSVSLDVRPGEIFILMGLSGSGKSTLVRCVNRLIEPTAGSVILDGEDVLAASPSRLRELRRHKMAMVFQGFGLLPHLRVLENIEYGLMIRGEPKAARKRKAQEMLELVGLSGWAEHYPETLSGGMRQRVGLARALATEADLLFMDEPFSALDPLIRHDLQGQLLELQRRLNKTIIFVTHDFQEALRIGNRVAVLRTGSVVQTARPAELVMAPADDYVAAFSRQIDPTQFLSVGDLALPDASSAAPGLAAVAVGDRLQDVYPLLAQHERLAVIGDGGACVGVLSRQDVFSHLAQVRAEQLRAAGATA